MDEVFINNFCKKSLETLDGLRQFFAKYHPEHPIREKMQAMYLGIKDIKNATKEPDELDNWYKLYESLCLSHVEVKNKLKKTYAENGKLKAEIKECWERVHSANDLVNQMIKNKNIQL